MVRKIYLFTILSLLMLIGFQNQGLCQYWGERVLEKSFEQMDFFFTSNYLNPYGLSNFSTTTPGLIDDPLLNLIVNPANIYSDSSKKSYIYLDFRNSQVKEDRSSNFYPQPYLDYRAEYSYDRIYYPSYYIQTRKALEPVFSGAFLTRPTRRSFLGITYQAIFQNEGYYSVPQDIYRSNIGYDYAGNRTWESSDVPIIDRYSGSDDMRQTGHFASLFAGVELSSKLQLGFKINRTLFQRDGSFGSNNFWEHAAQNYTSFWSDLRERNQDYDHWDFTGGINYHISDRTKIGLHGGYLFGDATQSMSQEDSSSYKTGQINVGDEWSLYEKMGATVQDWAHHGNTYYNGVNLNFSIDPSKTLNFYYTYSEHNADITLNSDVRDSSYSNYQYQWNTEYYHSEWDYALSDFREGGGDRRNRTHRFMGALQWQIEKTKKLHIGLNFDFQNRQINTSEHVLSDRHSRSDYVSHYDPDGRYYYNATREDKNLFWEFKAEVINFQTPIIFTWQLSESIEFLFGLNRKMTSWKIDDMTLALFNFREETVDSVTTKKTNFGERYTEPSESRTDVQTTMLAGITISPSKLFNVRLLVVPNFTNTYAGTTLREFQWWIGINLFP
jgi:hypothetical protein